jgi:hypothetical protein
LIRSSRVLLPAAIAIVWAGMVTSAQAASPQPQRTCAVVVGKAAKGKPSPVQSTTCSTNRNARSLKAVAAAKTLLMEWTVNANNNPPEGLTRIYANEGPCDRSGYKLHVGLIRYGWDGVISGFNTWNNCNVATGYDGYNTNGDRRTWDGTRNPCVCVSVGLVGHFMNDRISSFWIRRR